LWGKSLRTTEEAGCGRSTVVEILAINEAYNSIVSIQHSAADRFVLKCQKGIFKLWLDKELKLLEQESIESNEI